VAIEQIEVIPMLREALPEFGDAIREHIADWPDDPMLYLLVGPLFRHVAEARPGKERERLQFARRVYELVDRMLSEGSPSVSNCFAIEMIEPLSGDPEEAERCYPGIESALGPAGKKELAKMREWWRRKKHMDAAISRLNEQLGHNVLQAVGIGENSARVIVEPSKWSRLSEPRKDAIYQRLRSDWEGLTGRHRSLTIAGPRDTGFQVLRGN
jgi:hypothetical protein